jgi:hypothetical protein
MYEVHTVRPSMLHQKGGRAEKAHQVPPVMVPTEFIPQPLIFGIFHSAAGQMVGHFGLQGFGSAL